MPKTAEPDVVGSKDADEDVASPGPLYKKVKRFVLDRIHSGEWRSGDRVLSENELVKELGASRMTVNRGLRELTDEGYLERIAGVGTFVAQSRLQGHPLEVLNIADEIHSRGNRHRAKLICALEEPLAPDRAVPLGVAPGTSVFHSVIVHYENDRPIQLEDRYVNPSAAPDYLSVDFEKITPSEYLLEVAPLKKVEHTVRAVMPSDEVRRHLEMPRDEPCLLLVRRTWSFKGKSRPTVASTARLYYPSTRFQLGTPFSVNPPAR